MNQSDDRGALRGTELWSDGDVYGVLEEHGIDPRSDMKSINRAGLEAQKKGRLTPRVRDAWACLRNAERRVVLDLLVLEETSFLDEPSGSGDVARAEEGGLPDLWTRLQAGRPSGPLRLAPVQVPGTLLRGNR